MAMIAAIIIVYLILVITFRGGLAPFTILFSLPFTVIGVVLALIITGETISVPSLIGMLMLIGIVVTNAIVLIDRVINNEKQGMPMKQALIEAGGTRIRPILMTAIATIGALVPLLFGHDLSLIHISEPTRLGMISYAVFCLKKKKKKHILRNAVV
ncbi:Swarming motility protein SwrC [Clostridioides difficile]|nr:Swarming motility protein SwrC [Clostridioides difficile]